MGCVGYRGYFDRAEADALAAQLRAEGCEVSVYGVPAYSTLGWSNWLGGDPLLNTFISWPEGELARLIFHELAHQVVYAATTRRSTSPSPPRWSASAAQRWLARARQRARRAQDYAALDARRQDFRALTLALPRASSTRCTAAPRRRRQARAQGRADGRSCAPTTPR